MSTTKITLSDPQAGSKFRFRIRRPHFPWHIFTTKRVLNALYTFCAISAFCIGLFMTVLALKWIYPYTPSPEYAQPNLELSFTATMSYFNIILSPLNLYTGLAVGVLLIATFFAAAPGVMSNGVQSLIMLNFGVAFNILAVIAGGTIIWFRDLRVRENMGQAWEASPPDVQAMIQTQFNCCGFWNQTDPLQVITSKTCPSAAMPACVDPFGSFADVHLNWIFTFVYGVVALLCLWFLVNGCIISDRRMQHRFQLIDKKHKEMGCV